MQDDINKIYDYLKDKDFSGFILNSGVIIVNCKLFIESEMNVINGNARDKIKQLSYDRIKFVYVKCKEFDKLETK